MRAAGRWGSSPSADIPIDHLPDGGPGADPPDEQVRVAIHGLNGRADDLRDAFATINVTAEQPANLDSWVAGHGRRVVLLAVDEDSGYDLVVDLRDSRWDLVVVTLTPDASQATYRRALRAGATAAAPAAASAGEVVDVVKAALADLTVLPSSVARRLALDSPEMPTEYAPSLEEIDLLQQMAAGATTSDLAGSIGVNKSEMTRRLGRLYARMGADNRQSALIKAARWGILE
jgi:DNA-binding NarL/FixJ family response regulator